MQLSPMTGKSNMFLYPKTQNPEFETIRNNTNSAASNSSQAKNAEQVYGNEYANQCEAGRTNLENSSQYQNQASAREINP